MDEKTPRPFKFWAERTKEWVYGVWYPSVDQTWYDNGNGHPGLPCSPELVETLKFEWLAVELPAPASPATETVRAKQTYLEEEFRVLGNNWDETFPSQPITVAAGLLLNLDEKAIRQEAESPSTEKIETVAKAVVELQEYVVRVLKLKQDFIQHTGKGGPWVFVCGEAWAERLQKEYTAYGRNLTLCRRIQEIDGIVEISINRDIDVEACFLMLKKDPILRMGSAARPVSGGNANRTMRDPRP